ncbi:copper uptake system-associated protein [Devosia sp. 63-57]|uniref:copper uptake system-associated protein n=1 Tax=Devosia sp. 63-57 TaxID=1895751 RepID=UPI00086C5BB1|nr:copper uptake system-associated protein [Devosia sp. 63-57]ODT51029.1 MAG: hypothetical protein ABS74_02640 [Pelagibacterium sp. SCN 63-126]ODU84559.1 MAG: hypothetical protein ABT14_14285 [Pelagibacterium sp. SCN 63-17]OJX44312.1 MAG: hypothetical protein BGO80_01685 [Devosia sp. 63-57]
MKRFVLLLLLFMAQPAAAHEFLLGDLQIIHPAIPATPLDGDTAHIYMALVNNGTEPERLLAIETAYGKAVLERQVTDANGVATQQKMAWIDIPPGETVLLIQGEFRGRVEGLKEPLVEGGELDGAFVFEKRGRFKMFFMIDPIDPIEPIEELPMQASERADTSEATLAIAAALRAELGEDTAIAPLAIVGDVAIAGWTRGDIGARAFLRKREGSWQVVLWSGPSLLLPATLTSLGVGVQTADQLRKELATGETALGRDYITRFDAFAGTVPLN